MNSTNWQVITHWISPGGTESVQIADFDSYEATRAEVQRLAPHVGSFANGRLLKSLQICGEFGPLLSTPDEPAWTVRV